MARLGEDVTEVLD
jgi:transposase-like protein